MMTLQQNIKNFDRRWKIPYDAKEEFVKFRSRVLLSFDKHLDYTLSNSDLGTHFMTLMGVPPTTSKRSVYRYAAQVEETQIREARRMRGEAVDEPLNPPVNAPPQVEFHTTEIWDYISHVDNLRELVKCVQCVFWLRDYVFFDDTDSWDENIAWPFLESILNDIKVSRVPVKVKSPRWMSQSREVIFYRSGAQLLDEKLVNYNLEWLEGYSKNAKKFFTSALTAFCDKHYRDSINKMRLSLEPFLKRLLNNRKPLEKQTSYLGTYLKNKSISADIRNTYSTILDQYSKYQNAFAKHPDDRTASEPTEEEAEFIIYQTGSLMRFLIQLDSRQS